MKKLILVIPPIAALLIMAWLVLRPTQRAEAVCNSQINYGDVFDCDIGVAGETDTFTFTGTSGERVLVRMADASGPLSPKIVVKRPNGTQICSTASGDTQAEINACTLDASGIFTISASDNQGTGTGNYHLTLLRTNNPVNTTTIAYGQTLSGNLTNPVAYDAYTFTGATNEKVIVRAVDTSGSAFYPLIRVYKPDGSSACSTYGDPLAEINACALTSDGTYTILVGDNTGTNTGSYDLYLLRTNYPPTTTTIAYGQTLSGNLTDPLAYDAYTFAGATNEEIIVRAVDTSGSAFYPEIGVYKPDGSYSLLLELL